jgi:uncharacterized protein (DUF58 family)
MLSARAFLFAGLVVLAGVLALWTPSPALELFWRALFVVTVLAFVVDGVLAARRRLRGHVRESSLLPLGREVPLPIDVEIEPSAAATIALRGALPAGLDTPADLQIHRHPGERPLTIRLPVRAVALGEYADVRLPARVLGPLGLTWWRHAVPLDRPLRAVPDPATRALERSRVSPIGTTTLQHVGGGTDYFQLRPYRVGDPLRRIDWKASARSDELITRDVIVEQQQEVMLMIDVGRASRTEIDGLPRLGHFVNLASRLVALAAGTDDAIGLIAYADQPVVVVPPLRAATYAARLQQELARLAPRPTESSPLLAVLKLQTVVKHRTLVVLMTDIDDTAVATQFAAALGLIAQRHLPVVVDLESAAVAALEEAEPGGWFDPWVALAAQEFRRGQRANARRLSQIGCQVALVRPALAEERVARLYESIRLQRRL